MLSDDLRLIIRNLPGNNKKCTKVLNLAAVPSVNLYCKVHVTCTFEIGQGVVKLLMDHVMHIANCCFMTQHFSSIKGKKALSFTGYFAL